MAASYISTNDGLANTKKFRAAMEELGAWRRSSFGKNFLLMAVRDTMVQMRDGADNPANPANYALVTTKFGTENDTKSRLLFLEIDSVCALAGNGASTVNQIKAAVDQLEGLTQA